MAVVECDSGDSTRVDEEGRKWSALPVIEMKACTARRGERGEGRGEGGGVPDTCPQI